MDCEHAISQIAKHTKHCKTGDNNRRRSLQRLTAAPCTRLLLHRIGCTAQSSANTITSWSLKESAARFSRRHHSNHDAEAGDTHHHHCGPHRCRASCPHYALEQNSPPHCPYQMPQQPPSALACQCPLSDHTQQCMHCSLRQRLADCWCAQSQCTGQYQRLSARCAVLALKWLL
jgi:hypothetical protein